MIHTAGFVTPATLVLLSLSQERPAPGRNPSSYGSTYLLARTYATRAGARAACPRACPL